MESCIHNMIIIPVCAHTHTHTHTLTAYAPGPGTKLLMGLKRPSFE